MMPEACPEAKCYATLHKEPEHLNILVSAGVLQQIPHGRGGLAIILTTSKLKHYLQMQEHIALAF